MQGLPEGHHDDELQAALAELVRDVGPRRALSHLHKRPPRSRTNADRTAVLERHGRACVYCDRTIGPRTRWHVDHLTPRSLGGSENQDNLVAACIACNLMKRDSLGYVCPMCDGYAWAGDLTGTHAKVCAIRIATLVGRA